MMTVIFDENFAKRKAIMTTSILIIYPRKLSETEIKQISDLFSGVEVETMPDYVGKNIAMAYGVTHATQEDGYCYRIHTKTLVSAALFIGPQPIYVGKFSHKEIMQIWDMSQYFEGIVRFQEFIKVKTRRYCNQYKKHFRSSSSVNMTPIIPMIKEFGKDLGFARRSVAAAFEIHRLI